MSFKTLLTDLFKKKDGVVVKKKEPHISKVVEEDEEDEMDKEEAKLSKSLPAIEVKDLTTKTWKFSEDQKMVLVNLIAQGLTRTQIIQTCMDVHGFKPTAALIYTVKNSDKWDKLVMEARSKHFARMDLVDPSNKYVRVKRMDAIQERALKKGDLRSAISANEQIRKEFEKDSGDTLNIYQNNTLYQQFNTLSNDELIERHKKATKALKEKSNGSNRDAEKDLGRQPQHIEAEVVRSEDSKS